MGTPDIRHARRSESEPYIEERTFYSKEKDENGELMRTYHVRRVDIGKGRSYEVSMEVVAKSAAEDVLGRKSGPEEITRSLWDELWEKHG